MTEPTDCAALLAELRREIHRFAIGAIKRIALRDRHRVQAGLDRAAAAIEALLRENDRLRVVNDDLRYGRP